MYNAKEKFEYLIEEYHAPLYRLLYGYTGNQEDAEDGVQTAYLKLWESNKIFLSKEHAKNWLYKVAVNHVLDNKRKKWNAVERLESCEDIPFFTDESRDLYEEISQLEDNYRIVVLLYYYEGYKIKEISKLLGVNSSTVATRLARAREALRIKLEDEYYE